jgi:hypothetical protein
MRITFRGTDDVWGIMGPRSMKTEYRYPWFPYMHAAAGAENNLRGNPGYNPGYNTRLRKGQSPCQVDRSCWAYTVLQGATS